MFLLILLIPDPGPSEHGAKHARGKGDDSGPAPKEARIAEERRRFSGVVIPGAIVIIAFVLVNILVLFFIH